MPSCAAIATADGPLPCLQDVIKEGKENLSTFDITSDSAQTPIECEVAVVADNMTEEDLKDDMHDNTKVMVGGVMRQLKKQTNLTFEDMESLLAQSMVASPDTGYGVTNSDRYSKKGDKSKFMRNGKLSQSLLQEIRSWFTGVIKNKAALKDVNFDMAAMGKVVTVIHKSVNWLEKLLGDEPEYKEKKIIDLGVLRFPSSTSEYFQLYHLEVSAYIDATHEIDEDNDRNGLYVTFSSSRFVPRESIIEKLSEDAIKTGIEEAEKIYASWRQRESEGGESETKTRTSDPSTWPRVETEDGEVPTVISVFKNATDALKNFDMKSEGPAPVHCNLSVAFDDTAAKGLKNMGKFTLVMVSGLNRTLSKSSSLTYETLKSQLSSLSILTPDGSDMRSDVISKVYENEEFPGGEAREQVKKDVKLWLKKLTHDPEIMEDLQGLLDAQTLVNCLVTAGKHTSTLQKIKGSHEYNSRSVIDLAVLRYPDDVREYVHLYRITITAFTDCTRETVDEKDTCGLTGDFEAVKYVPRERVMRGISGRTLDRVSAEALQFYGAAH